jgi:hypothetical protein
MKQKINIAVIGGRKCSDEQYRLAQQLGGCIAESGWNLICGGGPGIMQAACQGAKEKQGITVGMLPSYDACEANQYLDVSLPLGIGLARNVFIVRVALVVVAIGGKHGTLSEIAFALNENKTVITLDSWQIPGVKKVTSVAEAIALIKKEVL